MAMDPVEVRARVIAYSFLGPRICPYHQKISKVCYGFVWSAAQPRRNIILLCTTECNGK